MDAAGTDTSSPLWEEPRAGGVLRQSKAIVETRGKGGIATRYYEVPWRTNSMSLRVWPSLRVAGRFRRRARRQRPDSDQQFGEQGLVRRCVTRRQCFLRRTTMLVLHADGRGISGSAGNHLPQALLASDAAWQALRDGGIVALFRHVRRPARETLRSSGSRIARRSATSRRRGDGRLRPSASNSEPGRSQSSRCCRAAGAAPSIPPALPSAA